VFLWDGEIPQLAERKRGNSHSWIVQTRVAGRTIRRKLGDVGDMPVAVAREMARGLLVELEDKAPGPDPKERIASFAPRFLADCKHQWKPSTLEGHRQGIQNQILPHLGDIAIGALSREDVLRWQAGLTCSAGTKNRALAVLSSMIRHGEILGLRAAGTNPCAGLRRRKSSFEADYLDAAGYRRFGVLLEREAGRFPLAVPLLRFIALTGCRRGEAMGARWDQLDGHRLALPDAKAGPKAIWLGKPVRDLLAALPRHGAGIFAGDDPKLLEAELRKLWPLVRKTLGRPHFRIHDLRHSYASVGVNGGFSLQVIGGLLGHSDLDSTAGYAHLDHARVAVASERVGTHLGRAFARAPKPKAKAQRKPPPKRILVPKRVPKAEHYERFEAMDASLRGFCTEHGLDPRLFLAGLRDRRKAADSERTGT
jgi:integrase